MSFNSDTHGLQGANLTIVDDEGYLWNIAGLDNDVVHDEDLDH